MKKCFVMVVDDDRDIREGLKEILEFEGYEVETAIHGQDALDLLLRIWNEKTPACIVLDLAMPIMNGSEFLKSIETTYKQKFGQIPIIVASANLNHLDSEVIKHAAKRLSKPLDLETLLSTIDYHCHAS